MAGGVAQGVYRTAPSLVLGEPSSLLLNSAGALIVDITSLDSAVLVDDAAFTPGTSNVDVIGYLADETASDSVNEGDAGAARITLDRRQIMASDTTDDAAPETGTRVSMIGGIFDDTASDAVDEGDAGWMRISADRKQLVAGSYVDDTAITPAGANSYALWIGAMADETAGDSVDEGDFGGLRMTLTRFLKTSQGDLISGEDQTNNLLQVITKPVSVSTYTPTQDTSAAAEKSSVTKASAGNLYGFSATNSNAAVRYLQFFNSTTVPADATVPVLEFVMPANGGAAFEWPMGRAFATGIAWCFSTTSQTKTIITAANDALVDVNYA
jgi:hypothetical protein